MLLAEYGVEYVEDPKTGKRIPSCHRTHVQSILNTVNYDLARKYADAESRLLYQDEAEAIDHIQKKIISISTKEEPYDVFLCYKESEDDTGERTKDSVLAFDLYEALTQKGIRVFFSRITLEDKLGQDYEPYIYSALRSARVMLLVTTSTEHAEAVWVKNEWKRFLSFMEEGEDKTLIPVYQDMSPYELPSELTKYQGQDLAKVGATQDLIHAVEKVLGRKQAESKINSTQLNELIADKQKREKQAVRSKRIIGAIVVTIIALLLDVISLFNVFTNGHWNFSAVQLLERYHDIAFTFTIVTGIALLIDLITLIYCAVKGYSRKLSEIGFAVGFIVLSGAILYMAQNGFYMTRIIVPYIANVLWLLLLSVFAFRQHEKKRGTTTLAVIGICSLVVLVSSVGQVAELENRRNPAAEQIKITADFINLMEEPDNEANMLVEIYKNQYYDVLSTQEVDDDTWYEIETDRIYRLEVRSVGFCGYDSVIAK
ncbi:MAG: TIR domain-containing protein [Lachnospiraceae bacterium]|nr:TIR domain-containing protein [Lachnospiraceae bacterium]